MQERKVHLEEGDLEELGLRRARGSAKHKTHG